MLEAILDSDGELTDRFRMVMGVVKNACPEHRNDPIGFCKEALGVRPLYHQRLILLSVRENKATAISSCHGAGKSHTAALATLWFFSTRKPAIVFTTAPTGEQVKSVLWGEIRDMHANARRRLPGVLQAVGIKGDGGGKNAKWYAKGRAARDGNAAQGLHSENLLIVYDEASGVRDEIRTSLLGALGDVNARELAIGNPTGEGGFFRDAWEKWRPFWTRFSLSALSMINVRRRRRIIPGMVGHEWVDDLRKRFKEGSPFWICRVLGQFFNFGEEKTIPSAWVKAAQARWTTTPEGLPRILLADVAASANNDCTGICIRAGLRLWPVEKYQQPDTMLNARHILDVAKASRCTVIRVDATGPGKGIGDKLNEMHQQGHAKGIKIERIGWGTKSSQPEHFDRLMDEMWWLARESFDPGTEGEPNKSAIAIPPSDGGGLVDDLCEQLPLRGYKINRANVIKVESKPELRARGAGSPDLADAAVMGFLPEEEQFTWSGRSKK